MTCTAGGCPRVARFEVTGQDFGNVVFTEYMCESCAYELAESADAFGEPVDVKPLERVA